jgi:hypothetical protein
MLEFPESTQPAGPELLPAPLVNPAALGVENSGAAGGTDADEIILISTHAQQGAPGVATTVLPPPSSIPLLPLQAGSLKPGSLE